MNIETRKNRSFITRIPKSINHIDTEKAFVHKWLESNICDFMWNKTDAKIFFLHSGPTYSNAELHLGNIYNLVLKDAINKMYSMLGYKVALCHGADTHGLPIINKVIESKFSDTLPSNEILWQECKNFALSCTESMRKSIDRMGIILHHQFYKTLSSEFEINQLLVFKNLVQKGYIKYALKPIFQCIFCKTALSMADMSRKNKDIQCMYFLFPTSIKNYFILIWTTQIYSIKFNQAVVINVNIQYASYVDEHNRNVIASKKFFDDRFINCVNISIDFVKECIASEDSTNNESHKAFRYRNMQDDICCVFDSKNVSAETGTAIVHLSSECSIEDYNILAKHNIKPRNATFDNEGKTVDGQTMHQIRDEVLNVMREKNLIFNIEIMNHCIEICSRCKREATVSCSMQCFFDLNHNNLQQLSMQESTEKVFLPSTKREEFISNTVKNTLYSTLALRKEWCISRQRIWGLFIPAIVCNVCGKVCISMILLDRYINHLKNFQQSSIWMSISKKEAFCEHCLSSDIDILLHTFDVWFDAGVTNIFVQDLFNIKNTNLIVEGNDQYKGWYQSLLLIEKAYRNNWKVDKVLCHGFIRDNSNQKLSKSLGNYKSSTEIINFYGAEILRIYLCLQEFSSDPIYSEEHMQQAQKEYHALRTTLRFLFWIVENTKHCDTITEENMTTWERLFYQHFVCITQKIIYEFKTNLALHKIWRITKEFLSDFNSFYLDSIKDIVFSEDIPNNIRNASIATICRKVLIDVLKLLSPIASFLCEEFWFFLLEENIVQQSSIFLSSALQENEAIQKGFLHINETENSLIKAISHFIDKSKCQSLFSIHKFTSDEILEIKRFSDILIERKNKKK